MKNPLCFSKIPMDYVPNCTKNQKYNYNYVTKLIHTHTDIYISDMIIYIVWCVE